MGFLFKVSSRDPPGGADFTRMFMIRARCSTISLIGLQSLVNARARVSGPRARASTPALS